jgi:hypothetical protein
MAIKPSTSRPALSTSIAGSDFVLLSKPKLQANVVIFGQNGQGKSTLCTDYAPHPVAFINFDKRADHAVYKAMEKGRKIFFLGIDTPANVSKLDDATVRKLGQSAVNKVIKNMEWAVEQSRKGNVRSICIDTGTEYSEVLNLAITGRVDRVKGDYGKSKDLINREWWRLFNLAREGNAHLIVLARAQEIWLANEPTGRFKPRGPEVMSDAADWCGIIRLKKSAAKKNSEKKFELEITKAGINIEELGAVYSEDDWGDDGAFTHACWMQYLETSSPEDWK